MRALLQRVSRARVRVGEETTGEIEGGLLVFVCAMPGDDAETGRKLAEKILKLRLFRDAEGRMNLNTADAGGALLVVSQFTLAADTARGTRPGFSRAAPPDLAEQLYDAFVAELRSRHGQVETGRFGADMAVELVNDGPVTIWLDTQLP